MAFTTAQILEALTVSMSAAYTRGLGAITPQWNRVATQVPSAGSSNFYGWLKDLPAIQEWLTTRQLVGWVAMAINRSSTRPSSPPSSSSASVEDDQIGSIRSSPKLRS